MCNTDSRGCSESRKDKCVEHRTVDIATTEIQIQRMLGGPLFSLDLLSLDPRFLQAIW